MSDAAVLFPPAAKLVTSVLARRLGVPVGRRKPTQGGRYVTLARTGGVRATLVSDAPQLTIDCWAKTPEEAEELAQQARAVLHGLVGSVVDGVPVYRVDELGGPTDLPHPSGSPRYTFTVAVHLRGRPL